MQRGSRSSCDRCDTNTEHLIRSPQRSASSCSSCCTSAHGDWSRVGSPLLAYALCNREDARLARSCGVGFTFRLVRCYHKGIRRAVTRGECSAFRVSTEHMYLLRWSALQGPKHHQRKHNSTRIRQTPIDGDFRPLSVWSLGSPQIQQRSLRNPKRPK